MSGSMGEAGVEDRRQVPIGGHPDLAGAYTTRRFVALGHDFSVTATDPVLGRYLDESLSGLAAPGLGKTRYYFLERQHPVYPFEVYHESERLARTAVPSYALRVLLCHVNTAAVESSPESITLHAASAALDGMAVVLPAAPEAGKTTLVAGLVRSGMQYLTDEAVAVDPDRLTIRPFPKPLSVDRGSWGVLADLEPAILDGAHRYRVDQWLVNPTSIRPDAVGGRSVPAFIVSPRYVAGARTELSPLRAAEAVYVLAESCFNLRTHGSEGLAVLARLAGSCPCFRLTVGDLDAACRLVSGLYEGLAA